MITVNGELIPWESSVRLFYNRGFRYGDALFETIKAAPPGLLFWEDHYFRLMASMRLLRMEIPSFFTMEFIENEILKNLAANALQNSPARVRLSVWRAGEGYYLPETNEISYCIETTPLENVFYSLPAGHFHIELFKEHYTPVGMLANLKTISKLPHVLGSVYARENGYDTCLLLNHEKRVVEGLTGNVFVVKGKSVKTPSLQEGCVNGILRKQLLKMPSAIHGYTLEEKPVEPFEVQQADEVFLTNVIGGICPVTMFRRKEYGFAAAETFTRALNDSLKQWVTSKNTE